MKKPILYILSGLPATGKSTLAKRLARETKSAHVRIDSIEQGLRDICNLTHVDSEGYRLAYLLATDILTAGCSVVADSVNPVSATREAWVRVATATNAEFINIEIVCSNAEEHRHRVESRNVGIANLKLPTWSQVQSSDYQSWSSRRFQLDTAGEDIEESFFELLSLIQKNSKT